MAIQIAKTNIGGYLEQAYRDMRKLDNLYRHSSHRYKVQIRRYRRACYTSAEILDAMKSVRFGNKKK